jgi:hypothetical protein
MIITTIISATGKLVLTWKVIHNYRKDIDSRRTNSPHRETHWLVFHILPASSTGQWPQHHTWHILANNKNSKAVFIE